MSSASIIPRQFFRFDGSCRGITALREVDIKESAWAYGVYNIAARSVTIRQPATEDSNASGKLIIDSHLVSIAHQGLLVSHNICLFRITLSQLRQG